MKTSLSVFYCCCLVLVLTSCSGMRGTPVGKAQQISEPVSCIVVLPARAGADEETSIKKAEKLNLRKGASLIDTLLLKELAGNIKVKIVSSSQLNSIDNDVPAGGLAATVGRIGDSMGCDAVMVTTMRRFKQRVGGAYGVDEPASAAFDIRLFNAKSKNVIWAADFNETQESLLSNIFSFGKAESRGFKWITVEELVTQGIQERLAECPYF